MKKKSFKKGYALFTAIILTGILVLIAYGTANLSIKQLLLTVNSADSHTTFYVADSGIECAMFWDIKNPNNPTISAFDISNSSGSVTCGGATVTTGSQTVLGQPSRVGGGGAGNRTSVFQVPVNSSCAIVYVTKNADNTTMIESRGYSSCAGVDRLERAIRITY
ncbi:MAG: hypothetical protein NTV02_00345 [Candidatus Zambryskibacteria bacterium]|nr:hypothetical protein [Candidatus Zambryskibacteria bacterium]